MQPTDYWIESPHGRLFARSWGLAEPATRARAIIVLFHDSLGCVDLWRDFPEQLSRATGCSVIAYDRLGLRPFGSVSRYPRCRLHTYRGNDQHSGALRTAPPRRDHPVRL